MKLATTVLLIAAALSASNHPAPAASEVHPIVAVESGFLLGATSGGRWLDATAAGRRIGPGRRYRCYSMTRVVGSETGSKPASQGAPCEGTLFVTLNRPGHRATHHLAQVALGGNWNALPRVPRLESPRSSVYRGVIRSILNQHSMPHARVHINQVLRVDLDGDGTDEVLISASHYSGSPISAGPPAVGTGAASGDYSIIVLRKLVNGKVRNIPIAGEFYPTAKTFSAPNVYWIIGTLDLKGDGKMEIITGSRYYEGSGVDVWQVTGSQVKDVLSAACGA